MVKYDARVIEIGPLVGEFSAAGVLVFFGASAPEELREFSIIHDGQDLEGQVSVGDQICLGEHCFRVLAVGEVANQNLAALGHFIVKFNGQSRPEMPGDICAEAAPLPQIEIGMQIQIRGPA